MFSFFNRVGSEPKSGRLTLPLFWKLTGFYLVMAWIMALTMLFCAMLAVRDGVSEWAIALILASLFLVSFAHWRKRQIDRDRAQFQSALDAYNDSLRKAGSEI